MNECRLEPFKKEHLEALDPGEREQFLMKHWEWEVAPMFEGKAISLMEGEKTLAVAGMSMVGDVPRLAALMSDGLRERPLFLHRFVKKALPRVAEFFGFPEIEAGARADDVPANRWLWALGFATLAALAAAQGLTRLAAAGIVDWAALDGLYVFVRQVL